VKNWKNWRVVRFFATFGRLYLGKRLPRTAAAMTYFMVLTLFPGIICLYDLLALAVAKPEAVFQVLESLVVPEQTRSIIEEFLRYAARSANGTVFVVAFVAMVMAASAVYRTFCGCAEEISGQRRFGIIGGTIASFVFAVAFMAAVFGSIMAIITGRQLIHKLDETVTWINIGDWWEWSRFVVLFLIILGMILVLYVLTTSREGSRRQFPGAFVAAVGMAAISVLFSWLFGRSAKYPLVYGSLASMILLMVWLNLLSYMIVIGSAVNQALFETRKQKGPEV
jgi:membrane protein